MPRSSDQPEVFYHTLKGMTCQISFASRPINVRILWIGLYLGEPS